MSIIPAIFSVIILLCWLALCIITYVPDFIKKTFKSQKIKKENAINNLFRDYVGLNNDAFNAYKALIQASFNSPQTHQQVKRYK
jgi:hypothetical protein